MRDPNAPLGGQKKILQLLHGLSTGGAEVLADRFGRRLADSYDVEFACLDNIGEIGERLQASGFPVTHLHRGSGIDFGCIRRLAKLIRTESVDLIHAHQYTPFFYSLATRWLRSSCPILFTEHGRFLPDYPRRKRMLFNRLMLGRTDCVVAVGNDVKRALVENEGLPCDRIEVIYNGIPVETFNPEGHLGARQRLREDLGLPADAMVAVQVARLDYLKDHLSAIRAIAKTTAAANIHLIVVGDGPEQAKIVQEINACEIADRVHLLGLRDDVAELLAAADILLLTSISEGIPLTLIEGMSAGLPIVSTNVGGVPEIVTDGVHGLLCAAGDSAALAAHMIRLAADPELRQRMGNAGRCEARERFSEDLMHAKYQQVIASMLGEQSATCR